MSKKLNLYQRIYDEICKIPEGKVATYGQVAAIIGFPRGARMVGWALRALPAHTKVPWPRVVNRDGMISIKNPKFSKDLQAQLLQEEGIEIEFRDGNFFVDLKKYLWRRQIKN
jgi:methylated-DNA-protein-cysteine methyltransferase-like protein